MTTVNVYEAKSSFSKLIARAEAGETIIVARNGRPVAQLGPVDAVRRPVTFGDLEGKIWMSDDFNEWAEEDERDWYGE